VQSLPAMGNILEQWLAALKLVTLVNHFVADHRHGKDDRHRSKGS
jgi:hypothetical protein